MLELKVGDRLTNDKGQNHVVINSTSRTGYNVTYEESQHTATYTPNQLVNQLGYVLVSDPRDAEIERLKAEVKEGYLLWIRVVNERDDATKESRILRARVEELEGDVKFWQGERDAYFAIRCTLIDEREALRDELEKSKKSNEYLAADGKRMETELELLRPKPVVTTQFAEVYPTGFGYRYESDTEANVLFTFTDGQLTGAEIIDADTK